MGGHVCFCSSDVCCDKINMIKLFFLSTYKKTKNTRDNPNMTHTSCITHTHDVTNTYKDNTIRPRWTHTSIGPGDWSEEVRLLVMIDRCQTEGNMRERAVKVPLHLHRNPGPHGINSQTLSPWEWSRTLTQGTHDAPRNKQEHTSYRGVSPFPAFPFYPFHLCNLLTGAFVQIEVQI